MVPELPRSFELFESQVVQVDKYLRYFKTIKIASAGKVIELPRGRRELNHLDVISLYQVRLPEILLF